jgi:hypothetical protein
MVRKRAVMQASERGILAGLLLTLLAFATAAQTRIMQGTANGPEIGLWGSLVGLYLPFVLFAMVSTYHFLDWAQKHKRQAIITIVLLVSLAWLFGGGTIGGGRQAVYPITGIRVSLTEQSQTVLPPMEQFPQAQGNLERVGEALSSTPYFSLAANALATLATLVVVALVLLRTRPRVKATIVKDAISAQTADFPAITVRGAIIRCYLLACKALQEQGMRILDSDTPSDIYLKATSETPRVASQLLKLTSLFQEAKFSMHPMTETSAADAREEWQQIAAQLASGAT